MCAQKTFFSQLLSMRPSHLSVLIALVVLTTSGPALAFSCNFQTECYETEPCQEADFTIEVILEEEKVSTEFGDLTVVAAKESDAITIIFATGGETEFLISVTPMAARASAHINEGPLSVSYFGICEGAF